MARAGLGSTWEAEAWDIFVKLIPVVRLLRQTDSEAFAIEGTAQTASLPGLTIS
jgi:hypothetical protein